MPTDAAAPRLVEPLETFGFVYHPELRQTLGHIIGEAYIYGTNENTAKDYMLAYIYNDGSATYWMNVNDYLAGNHQDDP